MKIETQIADTLRTIKAHLAYCRWISEYPGTEGMRGYDPGEEVDRFYHVVCNGCFHDALILASSLLDRDEKLVSFWGWKEFLASKRPELEKVCESFKAKGLLVARHQVVAHLNANQPSNFLPSSRRKGIAQPVLIEGLSSILEELIALFYQFTKESGSTYSQNYFDDSEAIAEVGAVMELAKPSLY